MRDLFILRGLPLSGKTKWCDDNKLMDCRIYLDYFRNILQSKILDIHGNAIRSLANDKMAHQMLFMTLENRMMHGDTIVIDDNHLTSSYFSKYKEYAHKFMYKFFIVDFSDVDINEIVRRDVDKKYTLQQLQEMQRSIKESNLLLKDAITIKPDGFKKLHHSVLQDLSRYKKIIHIGDIHGSYNVLKKCLKEMKDDEFYIFLGDYIDKGIQSYEVLEFLLNIADRPNVILLEGNHERNLLHFINDEKIHSKEFLLNTLPKMQSKGFNKNMAKRFYKKLKQIFCYKYHDKKVLCSHGGFSNMIDVHTVGANLAIYGCGEYMQMQELAKSFTKNTPVNVYQVFGHRNSQDVDMCVEERNFILESKVESGGFLRVLSLDKTGFKDVSVQNKYFLSSEKKESIIHTQKLFFALDFLQKNEIEDNLVLFTSNNKFTKNCANLPTLALFDKLEWNIILRGYDVAFYNYYPNLLDKKTLHFPLSAFNIQTKNLIHLSMYKNQFFTYTKYGLNNDKNTRLLHEIFESKTSTQTTEDLPSPRAENKIDILKDILQEYEYVYKHAITLVFALDCKNELELQDGIINNYESKNLDYYALQNISGMLQIKLKKHTANLQMQDFYTFIDSIVSEKYMQNHNGDVSLECEIYDSNGFNFSVPTYLHYEWEVLQFVIKEWKNANEIVQSKWINNEFREHFMQWFKENNLLQKDIYELKNMFLCYAKNKGTR